MKFSHDYQPTARRKASGQKKVVYSARVEPHTKEYLTTHKVKGGKVLDDFVKDEEEK